MLPDFPLEFIGSDDKNNASRWIDWDRLVVGSWRIVP
jgi:hypothetical protein